jgi:hypothetical protein
MPHPIFGQNFEKPLAKKTFILDVKNLDPKSTLIFGTANDVPTSLSIIPLLSITLPKETRAKNLAFSVPLLVSQKKKSM